MADDDIPPEQERFLNRAAEAFYLLLLFAGVALYAGYSFLYGAWLDVGIYAVSIPFILLGLGGLALSHLKRKEERKSVQA